MRILVSALVLILPVVNIFGIVTGQDLVDRARECIGMPYIWGHPLNQSPPWNGEKGIDDLYWYGWIWKRVVIIEGFDCSGLVSWCAELRRHFMVREFRDLGLFGAGRPFWEVAEPGDLIPNKSYSHIRILSVNKSESSKVYFIHAPGTGDTVKAESKSYNDLIEDGDHAYIFLEDNAGPEIVVIGVEEGGVYPPPVNLEYQVNDPNEGSWQVFYKGNYRRSEKLILTGDYTLNLFAYDWAKNESKKEINFRIEGPPQVVSTTPADGSQKVDINTTITITFTSSMDRGSVNSSTVLFDPPLHGGFTTSW
ncbi:MAG TPA: hypothetical protein EYP78_07155, partial [Candidatus Omnitrophica bacterium]|nr:hypothetical protein [Candidatus Omnitrophota bacterium]